MKSAYISFSKKSTITYRGKLVDLSTPRIMGILNITPDSFYDGGKYQDEITILKRAEQIVNEGADFIDIGACSTRPGADILSEEAELRRLLPVVRKINDLFPQIIISIDTFRSGVAESVIQEAGDCIVNDISAGLFDNKMFETVARLQIPYIMMHMRGTPANMQENPVYDNIIKEIILFFSERLARLKELGVNDVIADPGFGFGKTIEHNYLLMKELKTLNMLQLPIMVGISRKSMIYKLFDSNPDDSLPGTIVLNTWSLRNGANILRVHDVKEAVETVKIVKTIESAE